MSLICDSLIDLCFPEAHREVGEEKYRLKAAPEEMLPLRDSTGSLTTNCQNLRDIFQSEISSLPPGNPLAKGMEAASVH